MFHCRSDLQSDEGKVVVVGRPPGVIGVLHQFVRGEPLLPVAVVLPVVLGQDDVDVVLVNLADDVALIEFFLQRLQIM